MYETPTSNPLLDEINGLSPAAKSALMAAHGAAAGAATPTPQAAPTLPAPSGAPLPPPGTGGLHVPQQGAISQHLQPSNPSNAQTNDGGGVPYHPHPLALGNLTGDEAERQREATTGSGISQIYGDIAHSKLFNNDSLNQNHPFLGKVLGGAGKVLGGLAQGAATLGDIGLSAVAPEVAINTPGTAYHHRASMNELGSRIKEEQAQAESNARINEDNARTGLYTNPKFAPENTYSGPKNEPVSFDPKSGEIFYIDSDGKRQTNGIQRFIKPDFAAVPGEETTNGTAVVLDKNKGTETPVSGVRPVPKVSPNVAVPPTKTIEGADHKPHIMQWNPETKKFDIDQGIEGQQPQQPERAPIVFIPGPNGTSTPIAPKLGQALPAGAQTAAGVNSNNTVPAAQRGRSAVVEDTLKSVGDIGNAIDALSAQIGPIEGLKNESLLQHPLFTALASQETKDKLAQFGNLASQVELLKTGIGMAHYGVRGGPEDFRRTQAAYYSLAQDPKILKAHIQGGLNYLNNYLTDADKQHLSEDDVYSKIPPELQPNSSKTAPQGGTPPDPNPNGAPAGSHRAYVNGTWGNMKGNK